MSSKHFVLTSDVIGNHKEASQNEAWEALYYGAIFDMAATNSGTGNITDDYASGSILLVSGNNHSFAVTTAPSTIGFKFTLISPLGVSGTGLGFGGSQQNYWGRRGSTAGNGGGFGLINVGSAYAALECIYIGANKWLILNDTGWVAN